MIKKEFQHTQDDAQATTFCQILGLIATACLIFLGITGLLESYSLIENPKTDQLSNFINQWESIYEPSFNQLSF